MVITNINKNVLQFSFYEEGTEFPFNITALIDNQKIILIDLAYERFADQVKNYFIEKGFNEFEIFFTHHHEDHIDGIKSFADIKTTGSKNFVTDFQEHLQSDSKLKSFKPDQFLENLDGYSSQNFEIKFIHIPGHNNCEFAFLINDEILKIGDLIFFNKDDKQSLPYIDGHSFVEDYLESLIKLKKINASVLMTGHGKPVVGEKDVTNAIDKQLFYINSIKKNNNARIEDCLTEEKENYSGLNFHINNIQRARASK